MASTQHLTDETIVKEILDAPIGHVVTVLSNYFDCKIKLDLIEQNTPKPGSEFERKVTITMNGIPVVRAAIRFDKKILPENVLTQLLQKKRIVGTILNLNGIPNERKTVFLERNKKRIVRKYQIKFDKHVFFEVTEEIRLDFLAHIRKTFDRNSQIAN